VNTFLPPLSIGRSPCDGYIARITYHKEHNFQSPSNEVHPVKIKDHFEFTTKEGEPPWFPAQGACNGREMRRIMCVVDQQGQRFKVVDITDNSIQMDTST
jgi:hypothetical protein